MFSMFAYAENYKITKPLAWEAERTPEAIKELYGHDRNMTLDKRVIIISPKFATYRGEFIPIEINTEIAAKSIAVLQDANERALVVVFSVHDNTVLPYNIVIEMRQTAYLTIVVEGKDGKLYFNNVEIDVSSCTGTSVDDDSLILLYKDAFKAYMTKVEETFDSIFFLKNK